MKSRRPLLALALVSALTGCVSAPPAGPIVEYRPDSSPVTGKVPCDANYTLVARDENGPRNSFGEHHLLKGEQVGFRPETDGSVTATAPGFTRVLPSGAYAWEVVPRSVPTARERWMCETGRQASTALKVACVVLGVLGIVFVVAFMIALAHSNFLNYT